ncbi:MAG: dihydrolipoamide acetyltransferase family protein, partial [Candidatus Hydrogenedentes bacterium]|nr:dihydrolipoamide acetyltransferase family protein [Candidatus Hydrogenedentota bacterium]
MGEDIHAITVPKWGLTMEEGTVVEWTAEVGDAIAPGDEVITLETDKIANTVEIHETGILRRKVADIGELLPVGALLGVVAENGVDEAAIDAFIESFQSQRKAKPTPAPAKLAPARAPVRAPQKTGSASVSPRAQKLAEEKGIDPTLIPGTGRGGRVMRGDVLAYLNQEQPAAPVEAPQPEGTECAADTAPEPMTTMRKIVAERLTHSYTTTPHFFTTVSVDMTDLLAMRQEWKSQGAKYSVTDFIVKAVIAALVESPDVNASTDGQVILRHNDVHLGLAVALDDGLIVPVIRNANQLSLSELHDSAAGLIDKAHAKQLT